MRKRFIVLSIIPLLITLLFIPFAVDYNLAKSQKEPKFAKKFETELTSEEKEYIGVGYRVFFTESIGGETIVRFDSLLIDFTER